MTDDELDQLVAATAAITDERLADLALQVAAADLCEEIMSTPVIEEIQTARPAPASPPPKRRWAVAAAVLVALVGLAITSIGGSSNPAWAAPLVEFAESSPQLLLDGDGWEVSRADDYGDGEGEMTFANGDRQADLHWRAGSFRDWAADRAHNAALVETETVLGHLAQITRGAGSDTYTALWQQGDRTIEFRTEAESFEGFLDLAHRLRPVDVDAWLSAMPDSVIRSTERAAVVGEMLLGVPIPEGFDVDKLSSAGGVSDRSQLGAQVTGAVACAWVEQWVAAVAAGDPAAAGAAAQAMATSHDWTILNEMSNQGAWPQVIWMIADGMGGDGTTEDGVPVADFYGDALGCQQP